MLRVQSVGFPPSQSHTTTSQSPRTQNQPWLSSGAPGKPPLPTPSLRPQIGPQSLHQRSHILSPHQHTVSTTSSGQQSQPSTSSQSQDHLGQQMPPSRIQQSLSIQPLARGQGLGIQRPPSHALMQPTAVQPGPPSKAATTLEMGDPCTRILSKRSIQEIVTQVSVDMLNSPRVLRIYFLEIIPLYINFWKVFLYRLMEFKGEHMLRLYLLACRSSLDHFTTLVSCMVFLACQRRRTFHHKL